MSSVVDFLTYRLTGRQVDPEKFGVALGQVIDACRCQGCTADLTVAEAQRLAAERAVTL